MRRFLRPNRAGVLLLALLATGCLWWLRQENETDRQFVPQPMLAIPEGSRNGYTTNFTVAEDPVSEKGKWITGKTVGLDWSDVATRPGFAYGTESGKGGKDQSYDDAVALLTGAWEADQTVVATVRTVNQNRHVFEEVELRLRSSLTAHHSTGYEVLFRCLKTPEAYASIVRWDGPLAKFVYLSQKEGLQYGVSDGDLVQASITGNLITASINGVEVLRATDDTYSTGNPGMGFWLKRPSGITGWLRAGRNYNFDYGFTRFVAWELPKPESLPQKGQ